MSENKHCKSGQQRNLHLSTERIKSAISNNINLGRSEDEQVIDLAVFYKLIRNPEAAKVYWIYIPDFGQVMFMEGKWPRDLREALKVEDEYEEVTAGANDLDDAQHETVNPFSSAGVIKIENVGNSGTQQQLKRAGSMEEYLHYTEMVKLHALIKMIEGSDSNKHRPLSPLLPPSETSEDEEEGPEKDARKSAEAKFRAFRQDPRHLAFLKHFERLIAKSRRDHQKDGKSDPIKVEKAQDKPVISEPQAKPTEIDSVEDQNIIFPQNRSLVGLNIDETIDNGFGVNHPYDDGSTNFGNLQIGPANQLSAPADDLFADDFNFNTDFSTEPFTSFDTFTSNGTADPDDLTSDFNLLQPLISSFSTNVADEPTLPETEVSIYPDIPESFPTGNEQYLSSTNGPYYSSDYNDGDFFTDAFVDSALAAPFLGQDQSFDPLNASSLNSNDNADSTIDAITNATVIALNAGSSLSSPALGQGHSIVQTSSPSINSSIIATGVNEPTDASIITSPRNDTPTKAKNNKKKEKRAKKAKSTTPLDASSSPALGTGSSPAIAASSPPVLPASRPPPRRLGSPIRFTNERRAESGSFVMPSDRIRRAHEALQRALAAETARSPASSSSRGLPGAPAAGDDDDEE